MVTGWKAAEKILANEDYKPETISLAAAEKAEQIDFAMKDEEFEAGEDEYIGVGYGIGRIVVKVRMDGDKIGSIQYLELNDTLGICDPAITAIPAAIIESQSTTVDAVSGATRTSQGIIDAVNDALSKLKG